MPGDGRAGVLGGRRGVISGIAAAIKALKPSVRIVGTEAAALPAALRSREAGRVVTLGPADTIADGIAVRRIADSTFAMIERYVDDLVAVSEEDIAAAVLLLLEREKTVAEAACATTLAAVRCSLVGELAGKHVVMVLSGGNIDVNLLSRIIDRGLIRDGRLAHLRVRVQDRPGALAGITALLAERGANVLSLDHRRGTRGLWVTEAEVALTLETRGQEHVEELIAAFADQGYAVAPGERRASGTPLPPRRHALRLLRQRVSGGTADPGPRGATGAWRRQFRREPGHRLPRLQHSQGWRTRLGFPGGEPGRSGQLLRLATGVWSRLRRAVEEAAR